MYTCEWTKTILFKYKRQKPGDPCSFSGIAPFSLYNGVPSHEPHTVKHSSYIYIYGIFYVKSEVGGTYTRGDSCLMPTPRLYSYILFLFSFNFHMSPDASFSLYTYTRRARIVLYIEAFCHAYIYAGPLAVHQKRIIV